ncbi:NAD-dependent epimerase/dehydratase family protein [Soonwooa sp.]|uniref:NAD-dependent epimerase/dehydratase family protein n=1 Tax=Soonwooa sp. TaxID=1938592 RepID=UPI002897D229|nr:NAD-dependent epimerase/dehydratase family protein [Soonwooa sp.]
MESVIIFGASGFIGQNLLKKLPNSFDVKAISLRNKSWKTTSKDSDIFINLVGKAHDHKGTATEADYFYANLDLAKEIFNEFIQSNAKLLIHISSLAAIEEFESNNPLSESKKANPQSYYGKSKRAAEEWLLAQDLPQNKKIVILRPPMVHGPGDKGNLGLLYKLISKGIPYPLASFDNSRSFISIDNFSFFIKEIIKKQDQIVSGIYHISDDEPISTNRIIEIIKKVENKKVMDLSIPKTIVKGLAKVGDVIPIPLNTKRLKKMTSNLILSNHKIKAALQIENLPLSTEQGLEITIKSFKS